MERELQGHQPIRSSITETGYFERADREADRIIKDAAQVERTYKALLDGMTLAFDERRVRGTDVIQRVGPALAILLTCLAVVIQLLLDTTRSRLDVLGVLGVGVPTIVAVGIWLWWRVRRFGSLASRPFRQRHEQLQRFLADCATERLTRLRDAGWRRVKETLDGDPADETREWKNLFDEWNTFDRTLTRQCAELLDALTEDEGSQPAWSKPPEWKDLDIQVDRWALRTMLVSERPREFWRFPLPRLTFLYRFYPMMGNELRSDSIKVAEADVVSDSDLRFTISNQCNGRQLGPIKRWAEHQLEQSRSATDFVRALDEVGLRVGMTRKDFEAMLERMGEQLRQETPAAEG